LSNYKNYLGVYIPKEICLKNNFLGKTLSFNTGILNGFPGKLGSDGRLYIPNKLADEYKLGLNRIVLINGIIDSIHVKKYCKIKFRLKRGSKEFFCMFSPKFKNKQGVFKIEKIHGCFSLPKLMVDLLKNKNFVVLSNDEILIISHSSQLRLKTLYNITPEIVYYLGCYFADGTKKGHAWGIVASTFEQSRFYKRLYNRLVSNSQLKSYISVTSNKRIDNTKLIHMWENESKLDIYGVRNHFTRFKFSANRNEFGSLVMKDYRACLIDYYNELLREVIRKILKTQDKQMALEFISGVLEGDGCPSARNRGYILIASNDVDSKILEKILNVSGLNFKIINYDGHKINVRINALGLLSELTSLSNSLFKYYPKRRNKFIQRFLGVGAVKHFFNPKRKTSAWIKAWLKKEGFVNADYELTKKGKKTKSILVKMKKELE
jgi:hypothetical protein